MDKSKLEVVENLQMLLALVVDELDDVYYILVECGTKP